MLPEPLSTHCIYFKIASDMLEYHESWLSRECACYNTLAAFTNGAFPLHGTVRFGTAQFGSVAFPPQFSTAIEWAGLFTRRYNCAASTAVTSS